MLCIVVCIASGGNKYHTILVHTIIANAYICLMLQNLVDYAKEHDVPYRTVKHYVDTGKLQIAMKIDERHYIDSKTEFPSSYRKHKGRKKKTDLDLLK